MMASDRGSVGQRHRLDVGDEPRLAQARDRRDECPHPGGENHGFAPQDVSLDLDLGCGEEARVPLAQIDPGFPDIAVAIAAADGVDDALDAVDHRRPIHADILDRDPETAGGARLMKRVGGADQRLCRIAPRVEAGATHFPRSTIATRAPWPRASDAAVLPAAPAPMTIRSYGAAEPPGMETPCSSPFTR